MDKGRKYEHNVGKRYGVRPNPGSGNKWHSKGDLQVSSFLVEAKCTDAESFILKKEIWNKIRKEAEDKGKFPAMLINISGVELLVCDASWLEEIKGV